jgi:hypothetical protein
VEPTFSRETGVALTDPLLPVSAVSLRVAQLVALYKPFLADFNLLKAVGYGPQMFA